MEEKEQNEKIEKEESSEETQVPYTKSILMYLHIIGLVLSLFIFGEFFIIVAVLFGFGIIAYDAKYVGLAYFISFAVPLLLLFGLFLMCTSSLKH